MAHAEAMSGNGPRRWSTQSALPTVLTIACGIALGVLVLIVAQQPTRWLVYMLGGLVLLVVGAAGGMRRRYMLSYLVVALSMNVHYYVTLPEPMLRIGISSPTWFSIPLVLLPTVGLALSLLLTVWAGQIELRWGAPVTKYVLLVFVTAAVSTVLSSVRRYGIFTLAEMLQYFLIYLVAVNVVRSDDDVKLVTRVLLGTLALQVAVFLLQTATGTTFSLTGKIVSSTDEGIVRASGTVGTTASGYALFVEPLFFTALALWRSRATTMARSWTGGLALIGGVTLLLTLNRTSWGTMILGSVVVEILCRYRGIARELSYRTRLSLLAAVVVAALIAIPLILPRFTQEHTSDWESRRDLMLLAVNMIRHNFLVGVGPGGYPYHILEYAPSHIARDWLWVVHNEFLLIWAERGILGFLAWLAWMRSGFAQAVQASKTAAPEFQALGIGMVAALIGLMWEYSLNMWPPFSCYALLWFLFGLLVAGNNVYAAERDAGSTPRVAAAAV